MSLPYLKYHRVRFTEITLRCHYYINQHGWLSEGAMISHYCIYIHIYNCYSFSYVILDLDILFHQEHIFAGGFAFLLHGGFCWDTGRITTTYRICSAVGRLCSENTKANDINLPRINLTQPNYCLKDYSIYLCVHISFFVLSRIHFLKKTLGCCASRNKSKQITPT